MKILLSFNITILALIFSFEVRAQQQNAIPDLGSEKEFLEMAYWLQENPMAPGDSTFNSKVAILTKWIVTHHKDFVVNAAPLTNFLEANKNYKYIQEVVVLFFFGEAVYVVETKKKNDFENLAYKGMVVMLNYYNNLLRQDSANRNADLDRFNTLQDDNKLRAFVADKVRNKGK